MELAEAGSGRPVTIVVENATSARAAWNVEASFSRGLPRFHHLLSLGKARGPVAIVGGGPSLRRELLNLRAFKGPVISCGSVHDYLIEHQIVPKYHVAGDPDMDGVSLRWLRRPHPDVTYLIASQCPPEMFEALKDHHVRVWHLAVPDGPYAPDFRCEPSIPGAHFIIGRAWPLAAVMGHRELHFFGFDCSFPADCEGQHAYEYDWTLEEPCGVTLDGKRFVTTPGLLSQMYEFSNMLMNSRGTFKVHVHGDGLATAVVGA